MEGGRGRPRRGTACATTASITERIHRLPPRMTQKWRADAVMGTFSSRQFLFLATACALEPRSSLRTSAHHQKRRPREKKPSWGIQYMPSISKELGSGGAWKYTLDSPVRQQLKAGLNTGVVSDMSEQFTLAPTRASAYPRRPQILLRGERDKEVYAIEHLRLSRRCHGGGGVGKARPPGGRHPKLRDNPASSHLLQPVAERHFHPRSRASAPAVAPRRAWSRPRRWEARAAMDEPPGAAAARGRHRGEDVAWDDCAG